MDGDEGDFEFDTPSWRWNWWCVPTAIAQGVRLTVSSLVEDMVAAYNFQRDQEEFRLEAARDLETITKE